MNTKVLTYTGRVFDVLNPSAKDIDILDIAHSLAMQCRFNGHCNQFYSVAQHCVILSHQVDQYFAREALLHHAAEAYIGDIVTPLKQCLGTWGCRPAKSIHTIEMMIMTQIGKVFDTRVPISHEVHEADQRLKLNEKNDLMPPSPLLFAQLGTEPFELDHPIAPVGPAHAEALFMGRFEELC